MEPRVYSVTVQDTGCSFPCREDEFVLAAMVRSRAGPVGHGCFGGGCGVCKMQVLEGKYRVDKRMSRAHVSGQEEAESTVLLCCVKAESDLVIAVIE